jgi:FAD/FMN-containing dehydrogenase
MHTETIAQRGRQRPYWQALQELASKLPGKLLLPEDPDFEEQRSVWTSAVNRHPALIVRCTDASDVVASVTFAREQDLPVSVRSGGHSAAGYQSEHTTHALNKEH